MGYILLFVLGFALGTIPLVIWYYSRALQLRELREKQSEIAASLKRRSAQLDTRVQQVNSWQHAAESHWRQKANELQAANAAFDARKVRYDDIVRENSHLKQDLFNLGVNVKKFARDHAALAERQAQINERAAQLAEEYLDETRKWVTESLNTNNYASCKKRLLSAVTSCRSIGFEISDATANELLEKLKADFEAAVRREIAKQEQARIKAQIREDEKLRREIDKQIQDTEREKRAIEAALEKALREANNQHTAEVELLRAKLAEAEERSRRAMSQAQLTRAGHVYVISNIGAFGENVFKLGMTRRLDPDERIDELSSASVPFPFDIHMMISCDDAPALENALHRAFHRQRVNRINLRKEFFRVDIESIRRVVAEHHGVVDYVAEPAALQYRESLSMPDEDFDFVEHTVSSAMAAQGVAADDE